VATGVSLVVAMTAVGCAASSISVAGRAQAVDSNIASISTDSQIILFAFMTTLLPARQM
jgi:hypothetical protein